MDTIGDMIDKLTIANVRLWMLEDSRREFCKTQASKTESEIKDFLDKISNTNRERNDLIDQINGSLGVLIDEAANKKSSIRITSEQLLGTGKNKFYKMEDK